MPLPHSESEQQSLSLRLQTYWLYFKQALPWMQIMLTWDFIDTTGIAGMEWGSMITDYFYKDDDAFLNTTAALAGMGIGIFLAYHEYKAHRALNNYLDPDPGVEKIDPDVIDKTAVLPHQVMTMGVEAITHTTEKAVGVTQMCRLGITFFSKSFPAIAPYAHTAKELTHVGALFGAFFASGQEAKSIERAFRYENALAARRQ